ncbi:MAG: HipA domain-containing protein [Bacteroidota bacterium]
MGLKKLSPRLTHLQDLPFTTEELLREAIERAVKMSIQGVQPKLSAVLNVAKGRFDLVDMGGRFILKPQTHYPEVPQNEDLTMRLAALAGIETPLHGMVYTRDGQLCYFVHRFDREGIKGRLPQEDFAQLAGKERETKYDFSMEKLAGILDNYCTFPAREKAELFKRTLFCYLTGNEDMHLKNFSLLTRKNITSLTPAYDLLNSTIVLARPTEELALPLNGKKTRLKRSDLVDYYGLQRLKLPQTAVEKVLADLASKLPQWESLIEGSFLSEERQEKYIRLLTARRSLLEL